jgi:hypothetical protein
LEASLTWCARTNKNVIRMKSTQLVLARCVVLLTPLLAHALPYPALLAHHDEPDTPRQA